MTLGILLTGAASSAPATIEIATTSQPYVRLHVKNSDLRVRVALGFDKALLLNLPVAARAGLKPFPFIGKATFKGNLFPGGEALVRGNLYDVAVERQGPLAVPVLWFDKTLADDSDGVISALAIAAEHVVVTQAAAPRGGTVYAITRAGKLGAAINAEVGGIKVHVILDLRSPETVFNGSAAAAFDRAGLVKRTGKVGLWSPFPGVALPFERVTPAPGATLAGLPLIAPAARITEARAKELDARAKAGTSTADQDDDASGEITVTGRKKRAQAPWVLIGRDVLDHCSRIDLDRAGAKWMLTCNFS